MNKRRKRKALEAVALSIGEERPDVVHRMHVRVVHLDDHVTWVESSYLDPMYTTPASRRLFRVTHDNLNIAEHPIEDIVRFEWWAKAPLEYERHQREKRERDGA